MLAFQLPKYFGTVFLVLSRIKIQTTTYTGSQGILITFVEIIRSFHWDVRCRWKQYFLRKKNATFQRKNLFGRFFLVLSSMKNFKQQILTVNEVFYHLLWKLYYQFLRN